MRNASQGSVNPVSDHLAASYLPKSNGIPTNPESSHNYSTSSFSETNQQVPVSMTSKTTSGSNIPMGSEKKFSLSYASPSETNLSIQVKQDKKCDSIQEKKTSPKDDEFFLEGYGIVSLLDDGSDKDEENRIKTPPPPPNINLNLPPLSSMFKRDASGRVIIQAKVTSMPTTTMQSTSIPQPLANQSIGQQSGQYKLETNVNINNTPTDQPPRKLFPVQKRRVQMRSFLPATSDQAIQETISGVVEMARKPAIPQQPPPHRQQPQQIQQQLLQQPRTALYVQRSIPPQQQQKMVPRKPRRKGIPEVDLGSNDPLVILARIKKAHYEKEKIKIANGTKIVTDQELMANAAEEAAAERRRYYEESRMKSEIVAQPQQSMKFENPSGIQTGFLKRGVEGSGVKVEVQESKVLGNVTVESSSSDLTNPKKMKI